MLTTNPYNSRDAVKDPAYFKGRRELAAQIIRGLPLGYNVIGEPQSGKSSLLQFLSHPEGAFKTRAPAPHGERWLRLLIDLKRLPKHTDFTFWRYLLDALAGTCKTRGLETPEMLEAYEEAKATLDIYDIDVAVDKYIEGLGKDVLILLDNFEIIVNYFPAKDALETTGKLRSKNQDMIGNSFCYIVSSNDPVYELFENRGLPRVEASSFCSSLDYKFLESLDEESSLDLIEEPLRDCTDESLVFTEDEKDWILKFAGGHPALLKRTCYHLFEFKAGGGVDFDELRKAVERDWAVRGNLELLWARLGEAESRTNLKLRDSLAALADGERVSDTGVLRELIQRGVVTEAKGAPRVTAGIFIDFIRSLAGGLPQSNKSSASRKPSLVIKPGDGKRTVTFQGKEISLSSLELKLLTHLAENRNRPCTREELARVLWGNDVPGTGDKDALEHIIRRVRKKVEDDYKDPRWILSIRKQGYLFRDEEAVPSYNAALSAPLSYHGEIE